jgi:CubicO group peptidase (beta-lactamase class C family)
MQPEDGAYARADVSDGTDAPGLSMAENLQRIVRAGLSYRPGESWAYSVALDVIGAVLEQVQGRNLQDVLDDTIRTPLGAASLRFDLADDQRARLVTPYADGPAGPVLIPEDGMRVRFPGPVYAGLAGIDLVPARVFDPSSFRSGGVGLNGTAADMLAFVEAIRRGGAPIVSRATAAQMMTPQTGSLSITNRGPGWAFGLGGAVLTDPAAALSPQSPGTFGWGGVWGHSWFIEPARRLSVVSLTNTALEGMMGRTVRELRDAVCATFH